MGIPSTDAIAEQPVQVYVRVRPLIQEEEGHLLMDYKINNRKATATTTEVTSTKTSQNEAVLHVKMPAKPGAALNPAFMAAGAAPPPRFLRQREDWKVFDGFTNVLEPENTNEMVYQATIQPMILPQVIQNHQSACIFTYGHTGSGKSHTLLGYDNCKDNLGVYKYAAHDLLTFLNELDDLKEDLPHDQKRQILVRVTELYKDRARDLLTGDECTIREDKQGVAKVRGPMIEDAEGKIDQKPLGRLCETPQQVIDCVDQACESRRVGTSTHHSQSSRSHLVLELEVVTSALVEQRDLTTLHEGHLTRLKWLQTERMFGKHLDRKLPKWAETYQADKLRKEIRTYEAIVKESQSKLRDLEQGLGGTLVFCDLAGNEYARDAAGSTKEEMAEAAEINASLLAVKEMIRSLNKKNAAGSNTNKKNNHVSYRGSKLSIMLKRHVEGDSSRAIMMGHISPSQEYIRKTINTLNYCSMVGNTEGGAKPGKKTTTTAPSSLKGKENKV